MKLPQIKIFIIIACVVMPICAIFTLAKTIGLFKLPQGNIALNITSIVLYLLFMSLCIAMLTVNYQVTKTHLRLNFLGFDILKKKLYVSKILNIVHYQQENKLFLSYMLQDGQDPVIMLVNIDSKHYDKFVTAIKSVNPQVVYTEEE